MPSRLPHAASARTTLQRIATHVLARRRFAASGRFGLRATPGGFGTPAFGPPDAVEVVRVSGTTLLVEVGGELAARAVEGSTLSELAGVVGVDLDAPFDAGADTLAVGDRDEPLTLDAGAATGLAAWFHLGWQALDTVTATATAPTAVQLWPEHFDAGASVAVGSGPRDRCNIGASPGDAAVDEPYLYVGPWGSDRPGDPDFWNAPFGAVLRRGDVDSVEAAAAFFDRGIDLLRGNS